MVCKAGASCRLRRKGKARLSQGGVTQTRAHAGLQRVFYRYRRFRCAAAPVLLGVFFYLCSLGNFNCSVIK